MRSTSWQASKDRSANQGFSDGRKNAILAGEAELYGNGAMSVVDSEWFQPERRPKGHYMINLLVYVNDEADKNYAILDDDVELFMFPKTCLGILPGGRAKQRRNHNLSANRLQRGGHGERSPLWDEAVGRAHPRRSGSSAAERELRQTEAAIQLARRGLPGKTIQRLTGAPVADPTPAVVAAMHAQFSGRPPHQATSSRPPAPPANEVSADDVAKAFRSFPRGAAPGPNGLQPGFLQQLVGRGGEEGRALPLIAALVNLLADGGASAGLRPYLGGAKGTALHKVSKLVGLTSGRSVLAKLSAGWSGRCSFAPSFRPSVNICCRTDCQLVSDLGPKLCRTSTANGSTITATTWTGFAFLMTRGMPTTRSTTMCSGHVCGKLCLA